MQRLRRFLRSPRTAMWLISLAGVWIFLGTFVPQDATDLVAAEAWRVAHPVWAQITGAIGLQAAYSHPVLFALVGLLAASTAVCAWDRTRRSVRSWRHSESVLESDVAALRSRPHFIIELPAHEGRSSDVLVDAERILRAMRLRTRRGPSLLLARTPRLGLLGSPIFHWALVGLLLAVPLGWLVRSEGLLGVVEGESVIDAPESYGVLDVGPLHGSLSGLEIGVATPVELSYVTDGVERGVAPVVTLRDGDRVVAQGRVHANRPLRYGAMLVHQDDYGVGIVLADDVGGREGFLIDFAADAGAVASTEFQMSSETTPTTVVVIPHLETNADGMIALYEPREMRVTASGGSEWSVVLAEGDRFEVEGTTISIERIGYYARLSVVDNSALYVIYVLLGLAIIGITLAIAAPYRVVHMLVVTGENGRALHVRVAHFHREAAFVSRLGDRLSVALRATERVSR